jgi:hypothetical protein
LYLRQFLRDPKVVAALASTPKGALIWLRDVPSQTIRLDDFFLAFFPVFN